MTEFEGGVEAWEQPITIPTYPVGEPNRNPMFLDKRVYQGSSGAVYPLAVIDQLGDERIDRTYRAVFLENRYLKVMVLPEIGGRIQMALDKTNDYHFVYYNRVIKPALVGLAGPWISGGIEFNWPQHHRPSTFAPVSWSIQRRDDGSATAWVGEIDRMCGTRGMAGITLHPDRARIEVRVRIYNGTDQPQTMLWWANPAVPVNDDYQAVFPPDVRAVMDHGKRDVSRFPIADGRYYKVDYSAGVDIRWWKNIPVPTSYMAHHSAYDFVGGYDHGRQAGILHVADHRISPGKKLWTWGTSDFARAWERQLTDEDGPYVELMTGTFSDNQPDFSWLAPHEQRGFTQYFMPYKQIGMVKNATTEGAVSLDVDGRAARLGVYVTSPRKGLTVRLLCGERVLYSKTLDLSPTRAHLAEAALDGAVEPERLRLEAVSAEGACLVAYRVEPDRDGPTPAPAQALPAPAEVPSVEQLFLAGLHLQQYRHATRDPADYFREGLARDEGDARCNNALGRLLYQAGQFDRAEAHFRAAVERLTRLNPNPCDGEPFYNLGLCLVAQDRRDEAWDALSKATWNDAWKPAANFALARLSAGEGRVETAIDLCRLALQEKARHLKALHLLAALLRRAGRLEEASDAAARACELDRLDFAAAHEAGRVAAARGDDQASAEAAGRRDHLMRGDPQNVLELALDYLRAGLWSEAIDVLRAAVDACADAADAYPMLGYYLAFACHKAGLDEQAGQWLDRASRMGPDLCFPNRIESIGVLRYAMEANPADARAAYYLGNLLYAKGRAQAAIEAWQRSRDADPDLPTVHRNLALAYYNSRSDAEGAVSSLTRALELDASDGRVLYELDQLHRKVGKSPGERLGLLEEHRRVVDTRDDLTLEYVTLLNALGRWGEALEILTTRRFHPWEGGEGRVSRQYMQSLLGLARADLGRGDPKSAAARLEQALNWPENLGEGKLPAANFNDVRYYLGEALSRMGHDDQARKQWSLATRGESQPASALYYNDQPPELIFYQGLALRCLGREDDARRRFESLIEYGDAHIGDDVRIDYFAVSLPDFLVFEEDLRKRNIVHCHLVMGLGHLGMGRGDQAREHLTEALRRDPSDLPALRHLELARQEGIAQASEPQ